MSENNDNPTVPLPLATATQPLPIVEPTPAEPAKPRKKRRGLIALIVAVVVIALLVVAFIVGDRYAHTYATNYVRQQVATALGLKSTAPVHVDLGTGSILVQAISGHLDEAHVTVSPLTVQGVTGSASLSATGIPLDSSKPVGTMHIALTVPSKSLQSKLAASVPQLKQFGAKFRIVGDHIGVSMKFTLLGFIKIPITATVKPGVSKGGPTFTLETITIAGHKTTAAVLGRYVPSLLSSLKSGQTICIANQLPKEFTLTGVKLANSSITYTFSGDGAKLNDKALNAKGSCSSK